MMDKIIYRAEDRGSADHGWLQTNHSFSFASWYDPARTNFGALRVLNDDFVAAGKGFGTHPHDNMEIISIPLSGSLEHRDDMGNGSVIRAGEIQIMSAGTGVHHSEFNPSDTEKCNFLQIWIFPAVRNVSPRYDQMKYDSNDLRNRILQLVAPEESNVAGLIHALRINQRAFLSLAKPEEGHSIRYGKNFGGNGVFIFMIEGHAEINDQLLQERDAISLTGDGDITVHAERDSFILFIEVPVQGF